MSNFAKAGIVVSLLFVVFCFSLVAYGIDVNNNCVKMESGIVAQYTQNQNSYDNFFKKVKEVSQVPDMYTNDLKSVYDKLIKDRYAEKNENLLFQFIREHNPNFDASLYRQIQRVIEAGRNDFETNQKLLIDKKRIYENHLGVFPNNVVTGFLNFPKIDLKEYDIVSSVETKEIFKTKVSEPIALRS